MTSKVGPVDAAAVCGDCDVRPWSTPAAGATLIAVTRIGESPRVAADQLLATPTLRTEEGSR